ncbi:MAG: UDP-N-acetylmuramate--L-alanine ligase [Eubacteriales bacterium]|nr:UDP-N-acetylmuramate--L-alanine ligase [Eubacteriales bacterium]
MKQLSEVLNVHLIGAGGCSMSGLAQILAARGYTVTGSDKAASPFTARLAELGIPVAIGHDAKNVEGAELVIYSAAIKPDNPERAAAKALGIPEMERSVALGQISSRYKKVVGIAGCHGKTTVTSMLARINEADDLNATLHVGGFVDFLQGGVRLGSHDLFITEACEYVESFLTLSPTIAVINNIDDDHLDYYADIEAITNAFRKFLSLLPKDGLFIGCADDPRVAKLLQEATVRTVSYGMTAGDYQPADIRYDENGFPRFTVVHNGKPLGEIVLSVPGQHNIVNAIAATIVALELGASFAVIAKALRGYKLTRRRFEYYGEKNGVKVYHDYAHHPAEIKATLEGATRVPHNKLWVVFQCNSYTRAKTLFCENVTCFENADAVLVPDIYPGREVDTGMVHARDMVEGINKATHNAMYLSTFEEIANYLAAHAKPGDMVVTLGSGDVYLQTKKLL